MAILLVLSVASLHGGYNSLPAPRSSHAPSRTGRDVGVAVETPAPTVAAAIPTATFPPPSQEGPSGTSTVLVLDTSASMREPVADATETKLEAAKAAGGKLLDMIMVENQVAPSGDHKVAIVNYSDLSYVKAPLSNKISVARDALEALYTSGQSAMPKGLSTALELLPEEGGDRQIVILLSDGLPNIGLNDETDKELARQQVLDLAVQAGGRGICIYPVGFGDPASGTIDRDFLESIARSAGCGVYRNAQNSWQLANIYINLRHASTGDILFEGGGDIGGGETQPVADITVPENQEMMLFTLHWSAGKLETTLTDPQGQVVGPSTPGAYFFIYEGLTNIIIQDPRPGVWSISVTGAQVPTEKAAYQAVLSVRAAPVTPTPPPGIALRGPQLTYTGSPEMLVLVFLILGAATVLVITQRSRRTFRRKGHARAAFAYLIEAGGESPGAAHPLHDETLLGSDPACSLRLAGPAVSAQHARIRHYAGRWFVQTLHAEQGVYLNGSFVHAGELGDGDRLRIGPHEFIFRMPAKPYG